jgi:hypothetical protein
MLSLCAQALAAACVRDDDSPETNDPPAATQPTPWRTVTAPQAQGAGRPDCPAGWLVYDDPQGRFSVCYPAGYAATASADAVNIDNPRTDGQTSGLIGLAIGWSAAGATASYPPTEDECAVDIRVMGQTSTGVAELAVGGGTTRVCVAGGALDSVPPVPVEQLRGALPLAADGSPDEGYIRFDVNYTGVEETPQEALAILETLVVGGS